MFMSNLKPEDTITRFQLIVVYIRVILMNWSYAQVDILTCRFIQNFFLWKDSFSGDF